jgi:hypothetical protein
MIFSITIIASLLQQLVGVFPGVDDCVHGKKGASWQHGGNAEADVVRHFDQMLQVLHNYVLSVPKIQIATESSVYN